MIYFLVFILEILFLFLFSRALTNSLARLLYKISHSKGFTYNTLALIFLPGTLIHEIAHMLIAGIFFVPSGDITIFPEIEGDEIKFGSVKIAQTDPVRRFIIGVAPVFFGMFLILAVLFFSLQFYTSQTPWWQIALVIFLIFEVANTMFSSKKDMEGALVLFVVTTVLISAFLGTLYFTDALMPFLSWITSISYPNLSDFFRKSAGLMLIPVGLDLVFILLAKIFKV